MVIVLKGYPLRTRPCVKKPPGVWGLAVIGVVTTAFYTRTHDPSAGSRIRKLKLNRA